MAVAEQDANSQPGYSFLLGSAGVKCAKQYKLICFFFPARFLLFVFSLFPIGYAFYISLHKWRIQKGDFMGFENFLKALGNPLDILYVVVDWFFWAFRGQYGRK